MINRGRNVKNLPDGVELIKSDRKNYSYIRQQLEGAVLMQLWIIFVTRTKIRQRV